MSSDDEFATDHRRMSLGSPPPPSAGGQAPESPKFDPQEDGGLNGNQPHITPSEVAQTDDSVRQVLYSDVTLCV
jgi:hypothetical protein